MANKIQIVIAAIDRASKVIKGITSSLRIMDEKTVQASKRMGIAYAAAGAAVGALGLSMVRAAADFEQSQVAFTTMLGSAEKAKSFLEDLTNFAKRTPFELTGLEEASKKLLAYGIEQKKILPDLESLGNIAAGVGMEKLPNLILAFGQVKAATRLTGMELRQFTEAGVPMLDALAKGFGKTVPEIQKMVSAGQIGFPAVEAALKSLSGEGGRFANLMTKQSETLSGKWSNLKDAWDIFLRKEGKALLDWAKGFVDALISLVNNTLPKVISAVKSVTKFLGEHKVVLVAIGGYIGGTLIPSFVSLGKNIVKTLAATGPVGLAIAGLAVLIYGVVSAINELDDRLNKLVSGSMENLRDAYQNAENAWIKMKIAQKVYDEMGERGLKILTMSQEEYNKTLAYGQQLLGKAAPAIKTVTDFMRSLGFEAKKTGGKTKGAGTDIATAADEIKESMDGAYESVKNFELKGVESLASFRLGLVTTIATVPTEIESAFAAAEENMGELVQKTIAGVDAMQEKWGGFISTARGAQEALTSAWTTFRQGMGDAVAQAIVEGKSLGESFKSLMKNIAMQAISTLVQMGIERLALAIVYGTANLQEVTTRMASLSAETYAAAFAASVGTPIIGPAIAPGIAAAAVAAMLGGASASAGLGAGVGASIGALGGGLENVPAESTYLLHAGERVLSPAQNKELTEYLRGGGGGGGVVVNELNIMPGASIDEALFDKPVSWWADLAREKILPALNTLGRSGYKTAVAYDSMAVD